MKIVFLNTWGGRIAEPLMHFFQTHHDVDVFCLQEVHSVNNTNNDEQKKYSTQKHDIFEEVSQILEHSHDGFFYPHVFDFFGLTIFKRKNILTLKEGEVFVFREKGFIPEGDIGNHARNLQYITCEINNKKITVINFHGLWNGQGKDDTEDRLKQSENIIAFLKTLDHPFVLGGDFNLLPNTQSLKMIEDFGLKNLIKEYGIISTRTSFYTKENKFADYVFVSKGIQVEDFKVLPDEVSDHAPLYVKINA